MTGVVSKRQWRTPSAGRSASVPGSVRAPGTSSEPATGVFDSASHDAGALTSKVNVDLMSGWSNTA